MCDDCTMTLSCFIVPAPSSVTVTSDQANPLAVRPVGMDTVTLTCTVVLDASVDVSVTVNTMWTGPAGVALSPTDPVEVSSRRYTSTVTVSSFGRDQSGEYTCTATVSSASPSPLITGNPSMSGTSRITTGELVVAIVLLLYPINVQNPRHYHIYNIYIPLDLVSMVTAG